ncbi:DNA polymerase/3'-5' exonuclease PolX, partial [Candidatus Pacearchaeota archaeon ex4484_26]
MINQEVADLLYEMADILELKGVEWKPRAYRKAAQGIENLSEDLYAIYKKQGRKGLQNIPGVGEAIAKHIEEYLLKGKVKKFEQLKKSIPKGLSNLMEITSLGAKKTFVLYKKLGIRNLSDLKEAIKRHKIAKLAGFGIKSEQNISRGLEIFKKGQERTLLSDALPIAERIIFKLKKLKEIRRVSFAGSLRRMKETIGDVDVLVTSSKPKQVMDFFTRLAEVKRVVAKGTTKSTVILRNGMQCDVRVLKDEEYGAALQYFTGSKEHNIKLRELAIKKGYKLSEYGLFKGKKRIACRTEDEIYKKLGLQIMAPELRTNTGELEA